MAFFFKSIIGDMAFFIEKYLKTATPNLEDKSLHNLERMLLRASVIIEEAEGRHITNKGMVRQLNLLRKEMYRGYFIMGHLRSQEIEVKGHDVTSSFVVSKINYAKRIFLTTIDTYTEKDLQQVLNNLNTIIEDMNGLLVYLPNYPPLYRQPYSMHLFIGKFMFGRQMEMERIMDFLLQKENPDKGNVGVLPIVGPTWVGKSTLVAHVCKDARVHDYFSQVVTIHGDSINNGEFATLKKDGVLITHQNNSLGKNERVLVIIELPRDIDEVSWYSLYSTYGAYLGRGSRIIIKSRSNKVIKFGTTQALVLNFLPREAYWYFFKILTFGSTYSNDHPELESIAMQIAREMNGSFVCANVISGFLRDNFNSQFWSMCLDGLMKNFERNVSLLGRNPQDLINKCVPTASWIRDDEFFVLDKYRTTEDNAPMITVEDVVLGSIRHEGEFDVLEWKSQIPPYSFHIVSCTIQKSN